jgi:hypothetical protein
MVVAELAAAYEILRWGSSAGNTAIDIYGGGRLWWQRAEADLALTAGIAPAGFTVTEAGPCQVAATSPGSTRSLGCGCPHGLLGGIDGDDVVTCLPKKRFHDSDNDRLIIDDR